MPERSAREAMLDSAITLFRERGVAATSLRDVVALSGAPRGSIYHHFPGGKAQLAEEATQRAGDFIGALLSRLVAGDDPDRAVGSFVDYWSGALTSTDYRDGCPVAAAALSEDATESARAAAGVAFGQWETALAAALRERGVPAARSESLANLVVCSIEGALIVARARRSEEPLRRVGAELRSLLV
jgi:TetR/AcrR family transcriptional repressor of lmrAB and yxaGH operons